MLFFVFLFLLKSMFQLIPLIHKHLQTQQGKHTPTGTHTDTHTHPLTHSHAHTFTRSHTHTLTRSLIHTLKHSHTHTLTLTHFKCAHGLFHLHTLTNLLCYKNPLSSLSSEFAITSELKLNDNKFFSSYKGSCPMYCYVQHSLYPLDVRVSILNKIALSP